MGQPTRPITELMDFSGGMNTAEPPDQLGPGQVADVRNLEYRRTRGLKRRRGSIKNITGSLPWGAGSTVVSLFRHTPGASEDAMELWGVSNDAVPRIARLAAGTAWSASLTLPDAITAAADAWFLRGISFNGKLFLFYNSAVDRLHVWDGVSIKRAGMATAGVPTVTNTGTGTYAAIPRWYKVQWARLQPSGYFASGNLSAAVAFTPSGAGSGALITLPAVPGEGETSWRIFASPDGVNYYTLTGGAPVTTTYTDTSLPSSYSSAIASYAGYPTRADYFTTPPSAKFGLVDGAMLLMAGSHEFPALSSTIWYTPSLNTTAYTEGDDERVPSLNRIDIDPQLGGGITGLGGPIGGTPVVFKLDRTYLLNATSDVTLPYTRQLLTDAVGCVSYQGIVLAEDETGAPALYWPSRRGYYRYGAAGIEYLGIDIEDLWATVNLSAVNNITATYHRDAGQIWMLIPVGAGTQPSIRLKYHIQRARRSADGVRGGWTRDNGAGAAACSAICLFSDAPGSPMGLRLKPYLAANGTGGEVYKADADGINRDDNNATAFIASVLTRALDRGIGDTFGVQDVYVQGVGESIVSLDVSLRRNFDATDTIPAIAASLATTRGAVTVPGLELSECEFVQVRISDQSALDQHWSLDRIGVRVRAEAPKG